MIKIDNLTVSLGDFLLKDINLNVNSGEYFIVLGPNGAGKTVLLETIAGMHTVQKGSIFINDKDVSSLKPEKRNIGIVYQGRALFPHLTVGENISFGLKMKRFSKEVIVSKTIKMANMLGINDLLSRMPSTLSGGEKQKVALARALIVKPDLLLLDEPLSALDPLIKETMQQELMNIHQRIGVTVIHVTHDFDISMALGHRVAILNHGQIMQIGTSEDILRHPKSKFVANFTLSRNIFSGEAVSSDDGKVTIDIGNLQFVVSTSLRGRVHALIRPEDIYISDSIPDSFLENCFEGIINEYIDRGPVIYVKINLPPDFICLVTRRSFREMKLEKGKKVWIGFNNSSVHVFR